MPCVVDLLRCSDDGMEMTTLACGCTEHVAYTMVATDSTVRPTTVVRESGLPGLDWTVT